MNLFSVQRFFLLHNEIQSNLYRLHKVYDKVQLIQGTSFTTDWFGFCIW